MAAANGAAVLGPTIVFRCSTRNTVYEVLKARPGWVETQDDVDWDLCWADVGWVRDMYDQIQMDDDQRLNHFPNHYELTRKDLMVKNLKRMRKQLERNDCQAEAASYCFWTGTFVLPSEYGMFVEEFKRSPGAVWIMKPIGRAQGRGIFLFNKLSQISEWKKDHRWKADQPQAEAYIAQRYVENPYLIGGKKFDLRLYVLVTSFNPLTVWLYNGGFARFSGTRYCTDRAALANPYVHLTNVAIQKKSEDYDKEIGCKWDLQSLKMFLTLKHGARAVDELFYDMQCLITRSLLSVQKSIIHDKHCFELYGYDVLVDADLKPWLLEVNASPSLSAENAADKELKTQLISDVLDVVDLEGRLEGDEQSVASFRLIWANGPTDTRAAGGYSTFLGTEKPRAAVVATAAPPPPKPRQATKTMTGSPAVAGGGAARGKGGGTDGRVVSDP
ncbi:unnamed protein product [Ectocarpus sp. 4 AP-2014]